MSKLLSKELIDKLDVKKIWHFRFKRLDVDTMLVTNDLWAYCYLTNEEFKSFIDWWGNLSKAKKEELTFKKFYKDTEFYKNDYKYEYAMKNGFLAFWPILHIMVVTLRCDHKCKYCHAAAAPLTAKNVDMSIEVARKTVDTIFYTTSPVLTIEFQWWEPLVNWEVIKFVIDYADKKSKLLNKKVTYCLVTNMTLMDDEKLEYLLAHKVSISTSLDWDAQTHNFNRVFKEWNSHENVLKWIKKINQKYKDENKELWFLWAQKSMWALLTTTKMTLSRHKQVIDAYIDNWIDWIFIRPLNPYWFATSDLETLWYTEEEFLEFYKKSLDYIIETNQSWTLLREHFSSIFLSKILRPKDPNYLDDRSPCGATIWQVAYSFDWKIYSCDEWRMLARMWIDDFQIWEISDNPAKTYQDMVTSEQTSSLVQASTLDWMPGYNDSAYKTFMWVCPIHNYKLRWDIYPNFSLDAKRKIEYWVIDYLFIKMKDPEIKKIFVQWVREPWEIESCSI